MINTVQIELSSDFHSIHLPSNEILQGVLVYKTDMLGTTVHPISPHTAVTPAAALEVSSMHL